MHKHRQRMPTRPELPTIYKCIYYLTIIFLFILKWSLIITIGLLCLQLLLAQQIIFCDTQGNSTNNDTLFQETEYYPWHIRTATCYMTTILTISFFIIIAFTYAYPTTYMNYMKHLHTQYIIRTRRNDINLNINMLDIRDDYSNIIHPILPTLSKNFTLPVKINGFNINSLWDSGSAYTFITDKLLDQINLKFTEITIGPSSVTGHPLQLMGKIQLTIEFGRQKN